MSKQDTREKLENDVRSSLGFTVSDVFGWLDRQAAITEREVKERVDFSLIAQTANALFPDYQERIAELTAEVEAQRKRANDAERGVLSEEWYVSRDRYEDDIAELTAERDELQAALKRERVEWESERDYANLCEKRLSELTAERDELREALDACGTGTMYELWRKDHARLEAIRAALHDKPGT